MRYLNNLGANVQPESRHDDGQAPMTGTQEGRVTVLDDSEWVAWDLATVSGALSEIATTWRRAKPRHPGLPVGLPQHLADLAGRLAADVRSLAAGGPQKRRDRVLAPKSIESPDRREPACRCHPPVPRAPRQRA